MKSHYKSTGNYIIITENGEVIIQKPAPSNISNKISTQKSQLRQMNAHARIKHKNIVIQDMEIKKQEESIKVQLNRLKKVFKVDVS